MIAMIGGAKYAKHEQSSVNINEWWFKNDNNLQLASNTKYLTVGLKCRHLCWQLFKIQPIYTKINGNICIKISPKKLYNPYTN
jgi:hypothetical protein